MGPVAVRAGWEVTTVAASWDGATDDGAERAAAPDPELLRAALRATEARIARSSGPAAPVPHRTARPAPPRPTALASTDPIAAVEHRVDHLAESFGEAMQAHARFRAWVTEALADLAARADAGVGLGGGADPDVAARVAELADRLDAFDEQAARMVTYLTRLGEELERRMDRLEATVAERGTPPPAVTLRPIVPPGPRPG